MLEWLDEKHVEIRLLEAERALTSAIERAFEIRKLLPIEFGGSSGTGGITQAVIQAFGDTV